MFAFFLMQFLSKGNCFTLSIPMASFSVAIVREDYFFTSAKSSAATKVYRSVVSTLWFTVCLNPIELWFTYPFIINHWKRIMILKFHLDLVEFQQSNDRRTGKPIASTITRVQSQPLMSEVISEKPVNGVVLTEAKAMSMVGIMITLKLTRINSSRFKISRDLKLTKTSLFDPVISKE